MEWARKGVVATKISGEPIPLIQQRIFDVGFNDFYVILMGGDKFFFFLHCLGNVDVMTI